MMVVMAVVVTGVVPTAYPKVVLHHMLHLQRMHPAPQEKTEPSTEESQLRHRRQNYIPLLIGECQKAQKASVQAERDSILHDTHNISLRIHTLSGEWAGFPLFFRAVKLTPHP